MCANNWFPKEAVKPVFLIKLRIRIQLQIIRQLWPCESIRISKSVIRIMYFSLVGELSPEMLF